MVLSLAWSRNWPIHQLDVKNAFLNGDLSETVYMYQPPGFVDAQFPHHVCRLKRYLYGLKQAPHAWFQHFAGYANRVGFSSSRCDSSLFIYQHGSEVAYLLIYVDDIVSATSSMNLLQRMFLSQKKYALELLDKAHMANCNPTRTPVDTKSKLGSDGDPISDPTLYRSLAGGLHFKRVLRYVCGTIDFGLQLYASITGSLVAYIDADWAGCLTTRRSTSGYYVFFGDNLLSWSAKRQHTLSRSSVEAEYKGVANVVAETAWLCNILRELHTPLFSVTLVYCYNVHVLHVPSRCQYADIFTKGLSSALFEEFGTSLSVRPSPAQTARAY
ncbi:ribonuclease H-like domain-containing protein [Tanacetum coccineum]